MTPNDYMIEVKKFEMLRDAQGDDHVYLYNTRLNSAKTIAQVIDVLDDLYLPVLRQLDLSRSEKFTLLKETLKGHCGYFFDLPLTQMVNGATSALSGHVPARLERNVSTYSGDSAHISEPVTINFSYSSQGAVSSSGFVDMSGLREAVVDSITLQLLAMM